MRKPAILVEQQPPQGVSVHDRAGLVTNKLSLSEVHPHIGYNFRFHFIGNDCIPSWQIGQQTHAEIVRWLGGALVCDEWMVCRGLSSLHPLPFYVPTVSSRSCCVERCEEGARPVVIFSIFILLDT